MKNPGGSSGGVVLVCVRRVLSLGVYPSFVFFSSRVCRARTPTTNREDGTKTSSAGGGELGGQVWARLSVRASCPPLFLLGTCVGVRPLLSDLAERFEYNAKPARPSGYCPRAFAAACGRIVYPSAGCWLKPVPSVFFLALSLC